MCYNVIVLNCCVSNVTVTKCGECYLLRDFRQFNQSLLSVVVFILFELVAVQLNC
jgi:hypothetical protein